MTIPRLVSSARHGAVFGFAGWSGSGKTTLVEKIIAHLSSQGLDVATIKHAHHKFEADHAGKDSYRHRQAGSNQVLISSAKRSAHFIEHKPNTEPDLADLLAQLVPANLVLVEGFKSYPIEKIEIHRPSIGKPRIYLEDGLITAVASDSPIADCPLPFFDLDDIIGISAFIMAQTKIKQVG